MSAAPDPRDWDELERHLLPKFRHRHKPKPPPSPPPPPKPAPSWTLTNGPWIFEEVPNSGMCRPGPWTCLRIHPDEVCPGAPMWLADGAQHGRVLQAEGPNQYAAALEYEDEHPWPQPQALVTTLGLDPAAALRVGITSVFVECYLQEQANALDKIWQAGQDGWPDAIPCVGVYHDYPLENYVSWLKQFGKRFGVYTSDAFQESDWAVLEALCA